MPFGLKSAPTTLQEALNPTFHHLIGNCVLVFVDDILIYSKTLQEHKEHLSIVLQLLKEHQLFAKMSKCVFAVQQVEYLGHVISEEGVATDPAKTEAMVQWPTPTNVTELRGFLGLTGYYRKFVQKYGLLAKPLTTLLKKQSFQWTEAATTAFQLLKQAMATTPV